MPPTNDDNLTPYERQRDAQKRENEEMLRRLGLIDAAPPIQAKPSKAKKKKKKDTSALSTPRRSDRVAGTQIDYAALPDNYTEDDDDSDEDVRPKKRSKKSKSIGDAPRRKSARASRPISYAEVEEEAEEEVEEEDEEEEEELWLPLTQTSNVRRFNLQAIDRVEKDVLPNFFHM